MSKSRKPTDDVLAEADGTGAAARRFAEWKAANEDRLDALILTYNDDSASQLLEALRELFWSGR